MSEESEETSRNGMACSKCGKERRIGFETCAACSDDPHVVAPAITPAMAIEALNRMLRADSAAINALLRHRVPANEALKADPACQVEQDGCVSFFGVLGGIFGADARGLSYLTRVVDVAGAGDDVTDRFEVTNPAAYAQ